MSQWVPQPGTCWQGEVDCFVQKKSRLRCTWLLHWEVGYEHAWAIITDLPVAQANIAWYAMRAWIEAGFKDVKRGGWGWHHSKMREAGRVERLWLAYAVALVWTVAVGCQAEQALPSANVASLPPTHIAQQRHKHGDVSLARRLSCPQRGRIGLLAALLRSEVFPLGAIIVAPWPQLLTAPQKVLSTSRQRRRQKRREHKRRNKASKRRIAA